MNKRQFTIDGHFLSAPKSESSEIAKDLISNIDSILNEHPELASEFDIEIIIPESMDNIIHLKKIKIRQVAFLSGLLKSTLLAQLSMSLLLNGRILISLCGSPPLFCKNSVTILHDLPFWTSLKTSNIPLRWWHRFTIKHACSNSKKVITVSEHLKSEIINEGFLKDAEKVVAIYMGIDHVLKLSADEQILHKLYLENNSYFVAQSSALPGKNIEILMQAFAMPALKKVNLVLHGDSQKKDFEDLGMLVPENVIFSGNVSQAELNALMSNAIATLTPSLTDSFGLQALHGMALGCPAIVSPKGALVEVCGDVGLYANPYQPEAWVKAMVYLIENEDFRLSMSNKVKQHAKGFNWDTTTHKLLNLLHTI